MNIKQWFNEQINNDVKKPLPVLSFPGIQILGLTVKEMIATPENQAACMKVIADEFDCSASLSLMDLSVEAEAFGSTIKYSDDEVPTVTGSIVQTDEDAENLRVPEVGEGRTGVCVDAIKLAKQKITDRPVFAGVIGPFSLSGRMMDMTEIMIKCMIEPEQTHTVLKKASEFVLKYIEAMKAAGADGVVVAEPAAGLLSPAICEEFSSAYMREITEKVQDDSFAVIYHNCGNVIPLVDSILSIKAMAYHFGNAINISEMLALMPAEIPVLGNLSPADHFRNGTPESVAKATREMLESTKQYKNYIPSSGCDIPPVSPLENIRAFFKTVDEFYK